MSIASTTSKSGPYAGNGATTLFAVAFACFAASDLNVVRTDAAGVDTPLALGTDYSVSLNADQTNSPGGTVTLAVAPAAGLQVTILRNVALTQGTQLPNQGGWYPQVVEKALDKLTMLVQQLSEKVGRSVQVGVTAGDPSTLVTSILTAATTSTANANTAAAAASSASASAAAAAASAIGLAPIAPQAGNAGKGMGTTGAATRWENFGMKMVPVAGGALTDANCYYTFMTAAAVTLPDFTGSSTFGLASLTNSVAVPTTVTTSDGWTVTPGLTAGTYKAVAPSSATTAHGTWGSLGMTPPVVASVTAAAAPTILGTVQLAAGLVVVMFSAGANGYVMAIDTVNGIFGVPVALSSFAGTLGSCIFADSATNFTTCFNNSGTSTVSLQAGSVAGTTITLGASVTGAYSLSDTVVQMAPGSYVTHNTYLLEAWSVAGTVVSKGANTSLSNIGSPMLAARVSNTTLLLLGVGSPGPLQLSAQVATIAGTAVTGGATYTAATSVCAGNGLRFLKAFASGGPFLACAQDNTTATTGNWYGITVAGTVVTFGAVLPLVNNLPAGTAYPATFQYMPVSDPWAAFINYNATTMLLGHKGAPFAMTIAGTTLTAGANLAGSTAGKFTTDVATGANFYAIGSAMDTITVAGSTITSSAQVAIVPVIVASATVTDKAANYGATWYAWTLPTMRCAITATRWLAVSGSNIVLYGPIA